MIEDCTAVILAGGMSQRMGQDKTAMKLANDTLLQRSIDHMQGCFKHVIISVGEPKKNISLPQIVDKVAHQGPMLGIAAAMRQVQSPWLFVIACDMPFVSHDLIQAMAAQRKTQDVVVPKIHGVLQPLFAFYAQTSFAMLQTHIERGERSLKKMMEALDTEIIAEHICAKYDPSLLSFFDLDTPKDMLQAERIFKEKAKKG